MYINSSYGKVRNVPNMTPKERADRIIYRTSKSMQSAYAGRDFGILWAKYKRYKDFDEVVAMATTLRLAKYLIKPDYSLGFVLGYDPTFVNALTPRTLLDLGYDMTVVQLVFKSEEIQKCLDTIKL